jgi:hypothetical protein
LRGGATHEGRLHVKAISAPIRARQLPVDEHRTSCILAAGTAVVGWNQAVDCGFDQRSFIGH